MNSAAVASHASTKNSTSRRIVLASFPLAIWARDSLVDLYRVQGTSMEPQLQQGDVVLVRKCDRGTLLDVLWGIVGEVGGGNGGDNKNIDSTERARLVRYEYVQGITTHAPISRLYETPPLALTGHVVVFQDPTTFPRQVNVKRVIGVGGQYVRTSPSSTSSSPSNPRNRRLVVPPYSIYVEGDNLSNSLDSRQLGPIPKGLLVGVAEYVVWPPSRWRRIRRISPKDQYGHIRSYWP